MNTVDLKILALLQEDATRPVADIAERVCLSPSACWRRIERLQEDGVIRKRVTLLDADKLGVGLVAFVSIRAPEHSDSWLRGFLDAVRGIPEVVEFYRMSGEIDYLIKLQLDSVATYDAVYKRLIRATRLSDVTAAFALEQLKYTTELPLPNRVSERLAAPVYGVSLTESS